MCLNYEPITDYIVYIFKKIREIPTPKLYFHRLPDLTLIL